MTPKVKDTCEMQISEINHWLNEICKSKYGKPGSEIFEIYKLTKKAYARVFINAEIDRKRISKVMSVSSSKNNKRQLNYRN